MYYGIAVKSKISSLNPGSLDYADYERETIRSLFSELMHCTDITIKSCLDRLITRLTDPAEPENGGEPKPKSPRIASDVTRLGQVMCLLHTDYPGDVGVLMPVLLNYLELSVG